VPGFDERLTTELDRAARPADAVGVFERLDGRRARRATVRRAQAGLLAVAVLGVTAAGFVGLRAAFREEARPIGEEPVLPGNGEIVFSRDLAPSSSEHLFAVRPGVEGERQITSGGDAIYADPSVSPDGKTIVVQHFIPSFVGPTRQAVIATVPVEGGITTWLTDPIDLVRDPVWSPDGTSIAFAAMPPGASRRGIYVIDADGSGLELVVEIEGSDVMQPDWSPDGRSLVFVGFREGLPADEPSDLFVVARDGSSLRNLTETPDQSEWSPSWSPDGSTIAYHTAGGPGRESSIDLMSPTGEPSGRLFEDDVEIGDLDWSPDGRFLAFTSSLALTDTDDEGDPDVWTVRRDGSDLRNLTTEGASGIAWQPVPARVEPSPTVSPEPTVSPSPELEGKDIGLGFNLCHTEHLGGIDFLGDATRGTAWTGTKVKPNGTCPPYGGRSGVAVDFTGDGIADSWSGETMPYCVDCSPWKAADLNGDGSGELIVVVQGGTEIEFGLYAVRAVEPGGGPQVKPFLVGEPGHEAAGFVPGEPFTFWAGGDEGRSESVYCDALPTFWLTSISSVVDGGADAPSTVHETKVGIGTDGIAHVLDSRTTEGRYPEDVQAPYVTTGPACGIDFNWWQ
jgi:Tol biopolymer transport system component